MTMTENINDLTKAIVVLYNFLLNGQQNHFHITKAEDVGKSKFRPCSIQKLQ